MKSIQALVTCAVLGASSISFASIEGTQAVGVAGQEICIIDNAEVQQNFRDALARQVQAHGYAARAVTAAADCPVALQFIATYAMSGGYRRVLKYSKFRVLREGQEIGSVIYHFSRFGNGSVEEVIGKMVATLLPPGK